MNLTDYPELIAQWHPKNKLSPSSLTAGSHKKAWWKCSKGHEWQAIIVNRTMGRGCPYCSNQKVCKSNCLETTHPELAKEWHPTKNGKLNSTDVTAGSHKKAWWKCSKGHEWQAIIVNRTMGRGCPYCSNQKVCKSNCLETTHPELAKEWHLTKNGKLKPTDITAGSHKKAWWKCDQDHEWEAVVKSRTKGSGCPYCSGKKVCKSNCLETTHPELAKEWHLTKNGKLKPTDITAGSNKQKVWWKCSKGHEWEAVVSSRTRGSGCPYCSNQKVCKSNCLETTHPELAKEWHLTKNGKLKPTDITAGSHKKAWWKCDQGHEWEAVVSSRTRGSGCPVCKESKGEKAISNYLESKNYEFKTQYKFSSSKIPKAKFDFSIHQGLIEFNGKQHYIPVSFGSKREYGDKYVLYNTMRRDLKKLRWCKRNNIPLLVIPYWDIDRIPEIIDDFIAGKEPVFSKPPKIVKKYESTRKKFTEKLINKNLMET